MITFQQKFEKKPVAIVAGGAGCLGSFLCEALILNGCRVICLDKLSVGRKENLQKIFSSPDFSFFKHDLAKPFAFQDDVAFIFNLAVFPQSSQNLLGLAGRTGAKYLEVRGLGDRQAMAFGQVNARVVYVRDVYGPRMNLDRQSLTVSLFKAAIFGFPLKLPGDGLVKVYPTFVADVIYGITKAMFGAGTDGQQLALFERQGVSALTLAKKLQAKSSRELKIERQSGAKKLTDDLFSNQLKFSAEWHSQTLLDEGIERTLKFFAGRKRAALPPEQEASLLTSLPPVVGQPRRSGPLVFLALAVLIFLAPFLFLMTDFFWGGYHLQKSQQAVLDLDLKTAKRSAQKSTKSFVRLQKGLGYFAPFFELLGQRKLYQQGNQIISLAKISTDGLAHLGEVGETMEDLAGFVLKDEAGDLAARTSQMAADFDYSYRQFSLVQAELEKTQTTVWLARFGRWQQQLPAIRQLLGDAKALVLTLPELTGGRQKKTYLVLLQNNHELRPTGGFIGSFALVTFDRGRLADFEVQDVYNADGQLKGHVEPPAALKKYLGEANWWLRDSNWDPDFPTSAQRAAWFLQKETGRSVNGVLASNLFLAQQLLTAAGEIQLPDFDEKITAANLFDRAEYYAEVGFFPGSTQKQDFLGSLTRQLFLQAQQGSSQLWLQLARAFYQALVSRELLVWVDDIQTMATLHQLNWDGALPGADRRETDYLLLVEANVGVNKANYFLRRQVTHRTDIQPDGLVAEKIEIDYRNHSPADTFPGGNYRSYLRVLVPLGSRLKKVTLDKLAVAEEKIDVTSLHGKTVFGFLVEVPVQQGRLVEVTYELPTKIELQAVTQYRLLVQKQSGMRDESINLWLKVPPTVRILPAGNQVVPPTSVLSYSPAFDQDITFEASLVKK